ncbi:multidrug transporter [alpha proteobacterium AAP81b]|nr:multidrug transporter [alpha proteobacterium AAP81b]
MPLATPAALVPPAYPPPAPRAGPLRLDEVLESSRFYAPQVVEALAKLRGAEGKRLSAEGVFDTVFAADAEIRPTGYYDGSWAEARVTKPFTGIGGYAYGGYRIAGGEFPIYDDNRYTRLGGEVKAGAVLSLLRDRVIDERRFGLLQADIEIALAETDRALVAIGVQARAVAAYNSWVVAGLRRGIYRDLLALAERRQAGIRRQVALGQRPAILITENEQNILRRQTLVTQAEQALAQAATSLSLYYRDAEGNRLVPVEARLPGTLPPALRLSADAMTLAARRPDVRALEVRLAAASQRLALDRNALLPKLDLKVEANQDIGGSYPGNTARGQTETKVGLSLSVPFERRAAKGRLAQTRAEIDAAAARQRFLADQIATDIANLRVAADTAVRLAALARDEAERAATMAAAERRRFDLGAADFFLVNTREEAAADAAVRRLDAAFRQVVAAADIAAATADLTALGL